jgi:hypothetical protein
MKDILKGSNTITRRSIFEKMTEHEQERSLETASKLSEILIARTFNLIWNDKNSGADANYKNSNRTAEVKATSLTSTKKADFANSNISMDIYNRRVTSEETIFCCVYTNKSELVCIVTIPFLEIADDYLKKVQGIKGKSKQVNHVFNPFSKKHEIVYISSYEIIEKARTMVPARTYDLMVGARLEANRIKNEKNAVINEKRKNAKKKPKSNRITRFMTVSEGSKVIGCTYAKLRNNILHLSKTGKSRIFSGFENILVKASKDGKLKLRREVVEAYTKFQEEASQAA